MMENGNEHDVVDDEEGRGEDDDALVEEDNLSDEDMPFDDDDNMSDEDDNDEGSEDDNGDDLMLQLERNDPDLLNFVILYTDRPPDGWAALGESIGRNTMLNELDIDYEPLSEIGVNLYRGLVKNRSIKKLKLCSNRACGEIFLYLIPFFTKNKSLESLEIMYINGGRFDSLEYALDQFNGLKEFSLFCNDSIEGEDKVLQSLSGHTGLRKLHLSGVQIGMEGFTILAAMLLSPSCCLSTLSLYNQFNLDDELANILSTGLNGNGTLTELNLMGSLGCTRLTAIGWQAIFGPLKSATCMINTLNLRPILSQGFWFKIFVQDLDHLSGKKSCTESCQTPSKFAIFFLGFEQDSVQDSVQDFLQDSFPPPHSSSLLYYLLLSAPYLVESKQSSLIHDGRRSAGRISPRSN